MWPDPENETTERAANAMWVVSVHPQYVFVYIPTPKNEHISGGLTHIRDKVASIQNKQSIMYPPIHMCVAINPHTYKNLPQPCLFR